MMNHYHDVHSHTEMRPATSVASRSSGRGSAEYDDERVAFQEEHHYSHGMCHCSTSCLSLLSPVASGLQKTVGYFPRTMPDSGLPDADYGLKVPIPASVANSSNDSIHQFNEEGGLEGNCDDVYGRPAHSRDPSSNESSSPHCRDQASQFEKQFRAEMRRNNNFQYLMWAPDYESMAAVYAEIGEIPHCPSNQSRNSRLLESQYSDRNSISPHIFHSKSSSQTTLPSAALSRTQHEPGQGNYF